MVEVLQGGLDEVKLTPFMLGMTYCTGHRLYQTTVGPGLILELIRHLRVAGQTLHRQVTPEWLMTPMALCLKISMGAKTVQLHPGFLFGRHRSRAESITPTGQYR